MEDQYKADIERLYLHLYPLLLEYACSFLTSLSLAEEAVQDAFQIACQKPQALMDSPNPEGWMVNTLKNVIRNTLRRRNLDRKLLLEHLSAYAGELTADGDDISLELMYADVVASEEFRLVKAMALDGRSYLELAGELNISVAACRKRMQRAREFLQKKIAP